MKRLARWASVGIADLCSAAAEEHATSRALRKREREKELRAEGHSRNEARRLVALQFGNEKRD